MKNRLKTEIEQEEQLKAQQVVEPVVEEGIVPKKSNNKVGRTVSSVLSGRFLIAEKTLKHFPFLFFLAFLGLCYIANGYFAQGKDRELDALTTQIKELNTQYQISQAKLMYLSKESEVAKATGDIGLKEPVTPPDKIVIDNKVAIK
jgi:hypothetical protein